MATQTVLSAPAARPCNAQRRDAILAVAQAVFLEHGFDGASMSQVAARLGGSKGTLYSYFDSKEALFEALVATSCQRNRAAMFETAPGATPAESMHSFARAYVNLVCSDWGTRMLQVVAAEAQRRPDVGALFYDAGPAAALAGLADRIAGFARDGVVTVEDPMEAAETFLALCRGMLHLRRMLAQAPEPDGPAIEAAAARATAQFFRLYAPAA